MGRIPLRLTAAPFWGDYSARRFGRYELPHEKNGLFFGYQGSFKGIKQEPLTVTP